MSKKSKKRTSREMEPKHTRRITGGKVPYAPLSPTVTKGRKDTGEWTAT